MTYYGAKELAESFRTVHKNTMTIAKEIPEDKYGFRPAPNTRSIGELLAHIAISSGLQYQIQAEERRTTLVGFDFPSWLQRATEEEKQPHSKAQIIEMLQLSGDKWAGFLDGVSDSFLSERVETSPQMTPSSKSRFEMILSAKEHEMHHRGQLMVIERMIGIVPHLTREMQARMATATATAKS